MLTFNSIAQLAVQLRQERLTVEHEQSCMAQLNTQLTQLTAQLYQQAWLYRQQLTNLKQLIMARVDSSPAECCSRDRQLQLASFVPAAAQLGHRHHLYGQLLSCLRNCPQLLARLLQLPQLATASCCEQLVDTVYGSVFGSCLARDDQLQLLELLRLLIEQQVAGAEAPQLLLRRGGCAFSRLYRAFSEGLMAARLFLSVALRPPLHRLVTAADQWCTAAAAAADGDGRTVEQPPSAAASDCRLQAIVDEFVGDIAAAMHCFPASVAWLIGQLYWRLVSSQADATSSHSSRTQCARAVVVELVFTMFICAAVLDPVQYGLVRTPLSASVQRTLMQVGQMLQVLALKHWPDQNEQQQQQEQQQQHQQQQSERLSSCNGQSSAATQCDYSCAGGDQRGRAMAFILQLVLTMGCDERLADVVTAGTCCFQRSSLLITKHQLLQLLCLLRKTAAAAAPAGGDDESDKHHHHHQQHQQQNGTPSETPADKSEHGEESTVLTQEAHLASEGSVVNGEATASQVEEERADIEPAESEKIGTDIGDNVHEDELEDEIEKRVTSEEKEETADEPLQERRVFQLLAQLPVEQGDWSSLCQHECSAAAAAAGDAGQRPDRVAHGGEDAARSVESTKMDRTRRSRLFDRVPGRSRQKRPADLCQQQQQDARCVQVLVVELSGGANVSSVGLLSEDQVMGKHSAASTATTISNISDVSGTVSSTISATVSSTISSRDRREDGGPAAAEDEEASCTVSSLGRRENGGPAAAEDEEASCTSVDPPARQRLSCQTDSSAGEHTRDSWSADIVTGSDLSCSPTESTVAVSEFGALSLVESPTADTVPTLQQQQQHTVAAEQQCVSSQSLSEPDQSTGRLATVSQQQAPSRQSQSLNCNGKLSVHSSSSDISSAAPNSPSRSRNKLLHALGKRLIVRRRNSATSSSSSSSRRSGGVSLPAATAGSHTIEQQQTIDRISNSKCTSRTNSPATAAAPCTPAAAPPSPAPCTPAAVQVPVAYVLADVKHKLRQALSAPTACAAWPHCVPRGARHQCPLLAFLLVRLSEVAGRALEQQQQDADLAAGGPGGAAAGGAAAAGGGGGEMSDMLAVCHSAQLNETIRCVRLLSAEQRAGVLHQLAADLTARGRCFGHYLATSRRRLLADTAHVQLLVQQVRSACHQVSVALINRCVLLFMERHETSVAQFYDEFAALPVSDEKTQRLSEFLSQLLADPSWCTRDPQQLQLVQVAMERALMAQLYTAAVYPNGEADRCRDHLFDEHLARLAAVISPSHPALAIAPAYHYEAPWPGAQAEIVALSAHATAGDKLACVCRCCATIVRLLQLGGGGGGVTAADELTPVLVYVLIMARPAALLSTVQYVNNFYGDKLTGQQHYWWVQFCSAVEFIKTIDC